MPSPYLGFVDVQAHEFVGLLLCRFCHPVARMTSLFWLFLEKDLDMLVAIRTPPYHSWKNPVESIMSIINLALQAVGLMHSCMPEEFEKKISGCKKMKLIQQAAAGCPELQSVLQVYFMQPLC